MKPTLYLDSFALVNARKRDKTWPLDRSGRAFTIMARPRHFERGDGRVWVIAPDTASFKEYQRGDIDLTEYRRRFENHTLPMVVDFLLPGVMVAAARQSRSGEWAGVLVQDGDTLCCSCSKAASLAGECHRAWAAPFLVRAGWRVVLDGEEVAL